MVSLVRLTMQVKEMFLKNEKGLIYTVIIFLIFLSKNLDAGEEIKERVLQHLSSLNNFSASFIQNDSQILSEGKVYIGEKRVRAEYLYPSKILIILDHDKAMYYNYELEEDEFFNPKNTNAWFFYDIFRNPYFFKNSKIEIKTNELTLEKNGIDNEQSEYFVKIYFENNPLILRKIDLFLNGELLQIAIFNHNYNENFKSDFFKLINPSLLN